ncbi:MAG: RNA polymerase factor sigma-54 [Clostridiales Family XIII bacterium]|jgi:RNA polymerase sigma-54 factor|nr:RNA polymerase factor sigma-54 [Clostridiales Family XIII bacterium]
MYLGYELRIEQKQTLAMTPELIQAIKILQYNIQELNEYVDDQLLSNPMLELDTLGKTPDGAGKVAGAADEGGCAEQTAAAAEGAGNHENHDEEKRREDFDWKEYLQAQEYDDVSYANIKPAPSEQTDDISSFAQNKTYGTTLIDHLISQLGFSDLRGKAYEIGEYIIESLDSNGYLTMEAGDIAEQLGVSEECVNSIIATIKTFDPTGVGASSLQECLLLQLEERGEDTDIVRTIVNNHIEDIAAGRMALIANKCGITKDEVREIADTIRQLEPKPGRAFHDGADTSYIIPDVIVEKSADGYTATVRGDETPRLIISPYYKRILKNEDKDSPAAQFLSHRLSSAVWLIRSIDQRRNTIGKIADAIVRHQEEFLNKGTKYLRPLTLRMIADDVEMHESTVSRAVNGKYMQTPRGVFEIKYFFSRGTGANSAEKVASGGIKAYIEELIASENPASPFSDQCIADKLRMDGINISRRAIAKYRDEIGIPSSSARRRD